MRRKTLLWIILSASLVVLMSAGSVFAAGFALYEGSARGLVLGAGLTATADDASAVFYNPAGITQLKGVQTMVGFTAINPQINVTTTGVPGVGNASTGMESQWFFPPHAYVTIQHSDRLYSGYGLFTRFGLGTEFPQTWPGRYNSTKADVQSLEFNPNIAYKVTDTFSVAAGLSVMWFDVSLQRKLNTTALGVGDTNFELSGDAWSWGFNLAAHWKPTDWVSAGIAFRSRVEQDVDGDVSVSRTIVIPGAVNIANMTGSADITLPAMIFAGVAFKPLKNLTVGGGIYWTEWSTYDQLQVSFSQPFGAPPVSTSTSVKAWDDVFRYMIGVEWNVTPNWDLRLSYAFDEAPESDVHIDYILPDNDRHQFTVGLGWHNGPWLFDLSYMYILFEERDVAARPTDGIFAGKFEDGYAHLISFSLGYKF